MTTPVVRLLLLSGLLLSSSLAGAQSASIVGTPAPDAAAPAAFQLQYLSVFTHYQPFREQPLLPWQETNDTVGKIGGWRFYSRDAQQPEARTSPNDARPDPDKMRPSGSTEQSDQNSEPGRNP